MGNRTFGVMWLAGSIKGLRNAKLTLVNWFLNSIVLVLFPSDSIKARYELKLEEQKNEAKEAIEKAQAEAQRLKQVRDLAFSSGSDCI